MLGFSPLPGKTLVAAAAAIAVLVYNQDPGTDGTGGNIVTRGTSHGGGESGTAARIIVVAPADKAGSLMAELARAYPSRRIERTDSTPSGNQGKAIVIDIGTRGIQRTNPPLTTTLSDDPLTNPASVIMAIEGLDEPEPR